MHNDWIASETKNSHRIRDAIFSLSENQFLMILAPHFKDNERKRRKREIFYYCRRDCNNRAFLESFLEKFVAVHSWNKLDFSVAVRL